MMEQPSLDVEQTALRLGNRLLHQGKMISYMNIFLRKVGNLISDIGTFLLHPGNSISNHEDSFPEVGNDFSEVGTHISEMINGRPHPAAARPSLVRQAHHRLARGFLL
jgi:hypothetical protein